jgi:hypothetical protein
MKNLNNLRILENKIYKLGKDYVTVNKYAWEFIKLLYQG